MKTLCRTEQLFLNKMLRDKVSEYYGHFVIYSHSDRLRKIYPPLLRDHVKPFFSLAFKPHEYGLKSCLQRALSESNSKMFFFVCASVLYVYPLVPPQILSRDMLSLHFAEYQDSIDAPCALATPFSRVNDYSCVTCTYWFLRAISIVKLIILMKSPVVC